MDEYKNHHNYAKLDTLCLLFVVACFVVLPQTTAAQENSPQTDSLKVAYLDLVWESTDSYVPHFYPGKALHPGVGTVKVSVLSQVRRKQSDKVLSAEQIRYKWTLNGLYLSDKSGRGKTSITINNVTGQANTVAVELLTSAGDTIASESVSIPSAEPAVRLYGHPDEISVGIPQQQWAKAVRTQSGVELSRVEAKPYYYLVNSPTSEALSYRWSIDQQNNIDLAKNMIQIPNETDDVFGQSEDEKNVSVKVEDTTNPVFPTKTSRFSY